MYISIHIQLITNHKFCTCIASINSVSLKHNTQTIHDYTDDYTFKLGKHVPECLHHRLDQTVEKVFHPDEIVGYEMMEGVIVYARIMHPILPEWMESFSNIPRVNMKYMILTSPDDEEGSPVSVLELFKFLTGLKRERPSDEGETGLVRYEGETETVQIQQELRRERLQEICSDLSLQLDEIWKLPEEDRKKALRRLCLKWHPDKTLDNQQLAEAVFKFLNNEISKRTERSDFVHWEELQRTARRQRDYYQREQSDEYMQWLKLLHTCTQRSKSLLNSSDLQY